MVWTVTVKQTLFFDTKEGSANVPHSIDWSFFCIIHTIFTFLFRYASADLCILAVISLTSAIIATYISCSNPTGDICGHSCFMRYACTKSPLFMSSSSKSCSLLITPLHLLLLFYTVISDLPEYDRSFVISITRCRARTYDIIAYLVKFRTSTCSAISPNFKDGFSCFAYLQTIFYSFVTTPSAFAAPLF